MLQKRFGVSYYPTHMSRLLKQINYSAQQPIEQASQREEQAIETWKTEHWPALKKALNGKPVLRYAQFERRPETVSRSHQ